MRRDTAPTYHNCRLFRLCTECDGNFDDPRYPDGILWGQAFPPAALRQRTLEELFATLVIRERPRKALLMGRICHVCSSTLEHTLDVCEHQETESDDGLYQVRIHLTESRSMAV